VRIVAAAIGASRREIPDHAELKTAGIEPALRAM
jgi:hypothetical protein